MCSHLYIRRGEGLMICTHFTSDDEDADRGGVGWGRPHDQGGFSTLNTHDQHLLAAGPCNDFTYTVRL